MTKKSQSSSDKKEMSFSDLNMTLSEYSPDGAILEDSVYARIDEWIPTGNYILNAALSGSLFGGMPNRRSLQLAGLEGTGKTYLAMSICRQAQMMGYYVIYYDSEGAIDVDFVKKLGVDPKKFRIENVSTIEEFATNTAKLNEIMTNARKDGVAAPKIMVVLDSLGNLSSLKEKTDTTSGENKRDMTKQQAIRRTFRVIGNDFAKNAIPFIICNHVYACLNGDAEVLMSDGSYKTLMNISKGDAVMTINGAKEVMDSFKYDIKRYVSLKFEDGTELKCTPNHKFADSIKDGVIRWKTVDELSESDEVMLHGLKKLKLISKQEIEGDISVYDIEVQDEHHYILKNWMLSHNSIGAYFPTNEVSGGGGIKYNSSIIMMLTKSKLEDKETDDKNKKAGIDSTRVGIVITCTPIKQRFARPIKVQFHLPFYKKPNPYVGLEKYISWESCGIVRGKMLAEKDYLKLSESDRKLCHQFEGYFTTVVSDTAYEKLAKSEKKMVITDDDGVMTLTTLQPAYAMPKESSRNLVCKHLKGEIPLIDLFTEKVFTDEVLHQLDENIIKPTFRLPSIESLEDLNDLTEELEEADMDLDADIADHEETFEE